MSKAMTVTGDGIGGVIFDVLTWIGGTWLGIKIGFLLVGFATGMPIWVGALYACAGIMAVRSLFWIAQKGLGNVMDRGEKLVDKRMPVNTAPPPPEE